MTDVKTLAKRGVDMAVHNTAMTLSPDVVASLVLNGDLSKLNDVQKVAYYNALCERCSLDPATQPFKLLLLDGKLVMYADKGATQQMSQKNKISHQVTGKQKVDDCYVVTVRATMPDGRYTDEDGVVSLIGYKKDSGTYTLKGKELANAMMRAMTKAKRRAVLALLGLGMLDESELDTLDDAKPVPLPKQLTEAPKVEEKVTGVQIETKDTVDESGGVDPSHPLNAPHVDPKAPLGGTQPELAGKDWLQLALSVVPALAKRGDKDKAREWWAECQSRVTAGNMTVEQQEELRKALNASFPTKAAPQLPLFDGKGQPATPEEKAPPVASEAPKTPAPKPEPKKKSSPVEDLRAKVGAATKASVLFTLQNRIQKSKDIDDADRLALLTDVAVKLNQLGGGKAA